MNILRARPHIILMIGDDGVVWVPSGLPHAEPFFLSMDNQQAVQEIIDCIGRHPQARVTLCVDNLAQDYRGDHVPRLNFFDRAKLLRRRLKQHFPLARLTASLLSRQTKGQAVMIGLHESNPVFQWAEKLRMRLPRIVLLPVEGARLVAQLMPEAENGWAMLVSRQKSGGFRQIVTFKNELVFTRLTPLPVGAPEEDAEIVARDIRASLDYLTRHGLRQSQELSVLLLIDEARIDASAFEPLNLQAIEFLSPAAAAQALNLPFAPNAGDDDADILFAAHIAAAFRPSLSLMLPDARQMWQTRRTRWWGMRLATVCLTLAVAVTFWRAGDLATDLYQAQKESVRVAEAQRTLSQAQANAAPLTEPLGRLRQAVERRHIYEQTMPTPWHGLNEMADASGADFKIIQLDWKKIGDKTPEIFSVSLRVKSQAPEDDRAAIVAAFTRVTQNIAHAMPDYMISVTKPPYPALPQESVTVAAKTDTDDAVGEIVAQRKEP